MSYPNYRSSHKKPFFKDSLRFKDVFVTTELSSLLQTLLSYENKIVKLIHNFNVITSVRIFLRSAFAVNKMSDSKNPLKRWFRRGKIPNEKNCPGYVPELTKTINKIKKCLVYND